MTEAYSTLVLDAGRLIDLDLLDQRGVAPATKLEGFIRDRGGLSQAIARDTVARYQSLPPLRESLRRLSQFSFCLEQRIPVLRRDGALMARLVDPDVLAVFYPELICQDPRHYGWPALPYPENWPARHILSQGSVDTHVHLSGAVPPAYFWVLLMGGQFSVEVVRNLPDAREGHAQPDVWISRIARAAYLRYYLASYLQRIDPGCFPRLSAHPAFWREFDADARSQRFYALPSAISALRRMVPISPYQDLLQWALGPGALHPLAGERHLLYSLRSGREKDSALEEYLGVRNAFYGALSYEGGAYGLTRFGDNFDRRTFLSRPAAKNARWRRARRTILALERYATQLALDTSLTDAPYEAPATPHDPVKGIELRISLLPGRASVHLLDARLAGLHDHLNNQKQRYGLVPNHQVGFVVHLTKKGRPQAVDSETRALVAILDSYPYLRPFIVGVDVAGRELNATPRAYAASFATFRGHERTRPITPPEPPVRLGYTYHVGEDCADMCTGLRHIDEVATLLLGPLRGRLGHALVLGEDPKFYYERRNDKTEVAVSTRLLDLIWAWGKSRECGWGKKVVWIEEQLSDWVGRLNIAESTSKFNQIWERMGLKRNTTFRANQPSDVCTDAELFALLNVPISPAERSTITPDRQWFKLLKSLQRLLQTQVGAAGLTIEANPTSNLVVGGYDRYEQLPLFALVEGDIFVSINTDNPGMFGTSLAGEYAQLYYALLARGATPKEAIQWLAARRDDALRSTFLCAATPVGERAWTETAERTHLFAARQY